MLHGAFIVILAGAGVTHFWGKEGIIHLREGEKCDFFWLKEGNVQAELPLNWNYRISNLSDIRGRSVLHHTKVI